jgi:hypothetical protein
MKTRGFHLKIWADLPCPTCSAGVDQGCIVFGRDTLMKIRLHPHKSRVLAADVHNSKKGVRET